MDAFDHLFIQPADFDRSLAFYGETLGWTVQTAWGGEGAPRGAVLTSGGGVSLVLAEPHASDDDRDGGIAGARPTVHLATASVDERVAAFPDEVVEVAPEDNHWGTRWAVVRDPDGNLIAFESPPQES